MSKSILIFDMDGVLLKPRGYHRALQDTVRLGAREMGFDVALSDEEIAEFEGVGISSEWHSSAACLSTLAISGKLDLSPLFRLLKREQAQIPARLRLERAIQKLAEEAGVDPAHPVALIQKSESKDSFTNRTFQDMILGRNGRESYLLRYDEPLLDAEVRKKLCAWLGHPTRGGVVMTNRPSMEMPDAGFGLRLVGLEAMPLVGYGEMGQMAARFGGEAAHYSKPSPAHSLMAALRALGVADALEKTHAALNGGGREVLALFAAYEFWVFEDTLAGLVSVDALGKLMREAGLDVRINKVGVTASARKRVYLEERGARVVEMVNEGLQLVLSR